MNVKKYKVAIITPPFTRDPKGGVGVKKSFCFEGSEFCKKKNSKTGRGGPSPIQTWGGLTIPGVILGSF